MKKTKKILKISKNKSLEELEKYGFYKGDGYYKNIAYYYDGSSRAKLTKQLILCKRV